MGVLSLFQGHWRSLEKAWLKEFHKESSTVAIVTAGQPLAEHLMKMIDGDAAGVRFFPGIPKLSEALASCVAGQRVPFPQSIALSWLAGSKPESAPAAASFFERLIEIGISADNFDTIAHSTRGLHSKVHETSQAFNKYSANRNLLHPNAPDRITESGPANPQRFKRYMFYGFYDLNPAQRKYVKLLCKDADISWFSPVHPSHHFSTAFSRTLNFLSELGNGRNQRVDLHIPLSPKAQFADNLLRNKKLISTNGIQLLFCGAGTAFAKAVTDEVQLLAKKYKNSEIAVVSTGNEAKLLISQLHAAAIPCSSPLTLKASSLPAGCFLEKVLSLEDNRFHHRDIEKLLLTGMISLPGTPDATMYAERAGEQGARFGLDALRSTGFIFAGFLAEFFDELPKETTPVGYLERLRQLLRLLCDDCIPSVFMDSILLPEIFAVDQNVTFCVFKEMVEAALDVNVQLKKSDKCGVAVLSPEKARGILKKALLVTGLEEGQFPRLALKDPRLPLEVKKQLQLSSLETRETEEAFLLRQLFEAAEDKISIICRGTDTNGRTVALSPFIAPLNNSNSPLQPLHLSDSPVNVLYMPSNPPFLASSVQAQREKLTFDPEDPSPSAVHCGMIGSGLYSMEELTATALESYVRDPFTFMVEKIWDIHEVKDFPVCSEPHPRPRGTIVHACVAKVLETKLPVADIVAEICEKYKIVALLGSDTLADIWMKHLSSGIEKLVSQLEEMNWVFVDSEKSVHGKIADMPAQGRIDLIFKNSNNEYILADLKTGKPGTLKSSRGISIIRKGLFQLPFYRNLAIQNGLTPLAEAAYIHIQGNGEITFRALTNAELGGINDEFEEKVHEIVEAISLGDFHSDPKNDRHQ